MQLIENNARNLVGMIGWMDETLNAAFDPGLASRAMKTFQWRV